MNSVDRLIRMANQIANNLQTDADPVGATANHIQLFWDPRMKRMIIEHRGEALEPTAAAAIEKVAETYAAR